LLDIINTANKTIINLQSKINGYLGQINALQLSALQLQLNTALANLNAAYSL
jgi:hypothetical protein